MPETEVEDDVDLDGAGTPPDSGDADDPDGTPPAEVDGEPPEDKNWTDLRGKYQGLSDDEIRGKVAASYWEQTKALSGAAKRERDYELRIAKLEGRLEAGTTPAEPPPPPAEIQELDTYIGSLNARDEQVAGAQTDALTALSTAKEKIGEIKGLIKAAKEANDEDKASRLEGRLETAESRVDAIRDKLDATVRERKDIAWNRSRAQKEKAWVAKLTVEGQAREESEREELESSLAEIPRIVDASMEAVITAAGMPADPALREDLRETLRSKITIDLWKAGKTVAFTSVDVPGLLKQYTDRYMKAHGIAKRTTFQRTSEGKTRVSGAPPATPAAAPPGKPGAKPPHVVSGIGALPPGMLRARRILGQKGY